MMTTCPNCGSNEIVSGLSLFSSARGGPEPVFVTMVDPKGQDNDLTLGFRVDIFGNCGHAEFHTRYSKDLVNVRKRGYKNYEEQGRKKNSHSIGEVTSGAPAGTVLAFRH